VRSAPCTWRRGSRVFWLSLKTKVDDLFVVWPQNHWDGFLRFGLKTDGFEFPSLNLKTGSYALVTWASKSLRWFLGLGLKTMWAMVCQLRIKTDGRMRRCRGTSQDLATCFARKQVGLVFSILASRLAEVQLRVVHMAPSRKWCRDQVEDGRVDATGSLLPKNCRFLCTRP
jgi:hypothetical protein